MQNTVQVFSTCVLTILTSTAQTKVACDVFHQQIRQQDDDQCHHSNARRIEDKAYEHKPHYTSYTLKVSSPPPPPNPPSHSSHLVDKPLVQLFSGVQHESLPLRTFLALRHQCGVLIPLKQTWNLEQQQNVSLEKSNLIVYVKLCNGCNVSILPCF